MRRAAGFLLICCLLFSGASYGISIPGFDGSENRIIEIKGRFVVSFAEAAPVSKIQEGFGLFRVGIPSIEKVLDDYRVREMRPLVRATGTRAHGLDRMYIVEIAEDADDNAFINAMQGNPYVAAISHDYACEIALSPDDDSHNSQWAYKSTSPVQVHEAWDIETGSDTVIIAIIDTGVNYRHPDLRYNIWVNPGEDIDGDRVVFDSTDFDATDNDLNGYTDDVIGYDFFSGGSESPWSGEDSSVPDNDPNDFNGHGSHCAGIASAVTNNDNGVSGLAGGWGPDFSGRGAQIMCLRAGYSAVHPDYGYETGYVVMSAVVEAINYAVDNGADVISYSAGSSNVTGMQDALDAAMAAGLVFCTAAGNDNDYEPDYFGDFPGILAVAASDYSDNRASFSNYGNWIEICAPGVGIYSTYSNHYTPSYTSMQGTSMSTPMVAGLAALIKSHYPDSNKTFIDFLIQDRADPMPDVEFTYGWLGAGRINAYNCLQDAPVAKFSATPRFGPPPLAVTFTDESPAATSWSWAFGDGGGSLNQDTTYTYMTPGLYEVALTVDDPNGTDTEVKRDYICVTADTIYAADTATIAIGSPSPVAISMKNTLPLDTFILALSFPDSGPATLDYNGYSVAGTRCEGFTVQKKAETSTQIVLRFIAPIGSVNNQPLAPGDGVVANLMFTGTGGPTAEIDSTTLGGYKNLLDSRYGEYEPAFLAITVKLGKRGDANSDGDINVGDAVYMINFVFKSGPAPATTYQGDANADGDLNVGDAVYLINYVFKNGPAPPP
ncbi:MAG: S8 family serine peptidase [FCB group bacterium]|nr:S8 family serine peptidase [FCB group bacterium]